MKKIGLFDYAGTTTKNSFLKAFGIFLTFIIAQFITIFFLNGRFVLAFTAITFPLNFLFIVYLIAMAVRVGNSRKKIEGKKRYWLIPFSVIFGIFLGFFIWFETMNTQEALHHSIARYKQNQKMEKIKETDRKIAEEIKKRTPKTALSEPTEENKNFAEFMYKTADVICKNKGTFDEENRSFLYGENEVIVRGATYVTIKDNSLLENASVKIGTSLEDVYKIFGELNYYIEKDWDTVSYYTILNENSKNPLECSIRFNIKSGQVTQISANMEEISASEIWGER